MNHFSVLDQLNELFGDVNLGQLVFAAVASFLLLLAVLATVIRVRGQGSALILLCARDLMTACVFFLSVIGFPAGLFFMGRAFWRAGTGA